ncbi:MAG: hypothetical protein ACRD2L_24500 [Terriglobia bacterium]
MNATKDTSGPIGRTRLTNLPAFKVYEELQEIAARRIDRLDLGGETLEEETELALLRRADPLINLALAQFGASSKVGAVLYKLSQSSQGDPAYCSAIRQAILGNRWFPPLGNPLLDAIVLDENEIRRIFSDSDLQDANIVLKNPGAKTLLAHLYNRKKPFHDITDEKLIRCVYTSCGNACISEDDSSREGPDLYARDLQKGVWNLLKSLPTTEDAMQALHYLILNIDPRHAHYPEEDPLPVLQRWQSVASTEKPDGDTNGFPWSYTGGGDNLDFCVLIAALYGRFMTKTQSGAYESVNIGSADSSDMFLRCAFYGISIRESVRTKAKPGTMKEIEERQSLLLAAMRAAYQRDKDVFVFAALWNTSLFENRETRALLEHYVHGPRAIQRYWQRCKQIQKRRRDFDINPVSDDGRQKLESLDVIPAPTEDRQRLQTLEESIVSTRKAVAALSRRSEWVFILLVVIMVMIWWRM